MLEVMDMSLVQCDIQKDIDKLWSFNLNIKSKEKSGMVNKERISLISIELF